MLAARAGRRPARAQPVPAKFKVLALTESGGHHVAFTKAAKPWLLKYGEENGFEVDYISDTTGAQRVHLHGARALAF